MRSIHLVTLKTLERVVKHPLYYLVGIASEKLVYLTTEEDILDLWISDLDGSKRKRITHGGVFQVAELEKDSRYIYYTKDVMKGLEKHKVFVADIKEGNVSEAFEMEPLRIFGLAAKQDTIVYSGSTEKDIGLYIAKQGGKSEKLFSGKELFFITDTNGKISVGFGNLRGNPRSQEILIYNHESEEKIIYTPKEGSINETPKIYGEYKILFASNYEGSKRLYLYDLKKDDLAPPKLRYRDHEEIEITDYINYGVTYNGEIWFIGLSNARGYAFIDGKRVNHPPGTPGSLEVHNNYVYLHFSTLKDPQAIYRVKREGDGWEMVIGKELPTDIKDRFGDVKIVSYKSFDGLEIPCIIFEANIEKPGPTILFVHGGPWSYVGDYWRAFITSLVAAGYHVVAPNFRGSTGYGEEFKLLDIGDPGGGDLMDVVYARKYAIETGLASKIAIMGYSYGGYMTFLATAKEPDLWECGVAGAGITDWEETYELSDAIFKQFIEILFDKKKELLRDRSPIKYVDNLKAPLCIIHPQNDTRTPLKPVLKYCNRILEKGRTFELHVLPDIGHVIMNTDDLIKVLYPALTFLHNHLKKKTSR